MEQFNQQTPQQFPQQQPPQSFPPQPPPPQTFQQVNLHKNKSTALLIAAITIIALFLHWVVVHRIGANEQGQRAEDDITLNGFNGWGWLALAGVAGVFFASLNGNRLQDYDKNSKNIVMASFGAMVGAALAWYINTTSNAADIIAKAKANNIEATVSPGIGMWMAGIAGLIGLAWVSGIIKNLQQANMQRPPVYNQQPPQPFQQQPPQQYYQQPPQQFQQQPPQNPQSNQNSYPPPPPPTH